MRRSIYLLTIALIAPIVMMAQGRIAEIWTQPAVFTADEQVTFFFDVTGTELADVNEDIYLWSWYPSEPDAGNGANSSDFAKLTKVEGNIWKIAIIPTDYYGVEASQISAFYGLLKTRNFSKATGAFAPDSDPPNHISIYGLNTIKGDVIIDYHPKQFTLDRPFSVLVNANNTWPGQCDGNPVQGELANAPNVHVHSGINNWSKVIENNPANVNKTKLAYLGEGIYRWDFIPNEYFSLETGFPVDNISMVFASSNWSIIGKGENCSDFFIDVPEVPDMPIPQLSFFPSKFSSKDIFCIIRKDNEQFVSSLKYSISGGGKTFTGTFDGSNKEFTAYVNLVDQLKESGNVDKINIVITDNTGRKVLDSDIPLVKLNQ